MEDLKKALDAAAKVKERGERAVAVAAVIAEALRQVGQDPILVGGAAVEFYTEGGYSTKDIDLVSEGGEDLIQVMEGLGFEKFGKDFVDKKRNIYVEFPSRSLKPGETAIPVKVGDRSLRLISIEDLIVDRLCAYKFWKSGIDGVNAWLLIEIGVSDEDRLQKRAEMEDVRDALDAVRSAREQIIRKKLSRKKANRLLEQKMREL